MAKVKGIETYKRYWEDQASFMDQSPWDLRKILKLTFSNDFDKHIEELKFSDHSISKEDGKLILRLKVPYNYSELDEGYRALGYRQELLNRYELHQF